MHHSVTMQGPEIVQKIGDKLETASLCFAFSGLFTLLHFAGLKVFFIYISGDWLPVLNEELKVVQTKMKKEKKISLDYFCLDKINQNLILLLFCKLIK